MPPVKSDTALRNIGEFIRKLATQADDTPTIPAAGEPWVSFSRAGLGWVWLSGDEAREYGRLVRELLGVLQDRPSCGSRWVANQLQRAILEALDITKRREGVGLDARIDQALEQLKQEIARPPVPWEVYVPIAGLLPPRRPVHLGEISFRGVTQRFVKKLERPMRRSLWRDFWEEWKGLKAVAHVRLRGYEGEAVDAAAVQALLPVLDTLNFFADIAHDRRDPAILHLPGEQPAGLDERLHVIHNPEPKLATSLKRVGRPAAFDLARLKSPRMRRLGGAQVLALLSRPAHTVAERRILVALQWAGRATREPRAEQAFLLYMISLEALVLGPDAASELGYRLRLRVAHLLGRNPTARAAVAKLVKESYDVRGKIVHAGALGVTEGQLQGARDLAKHAIIAALRRPDFRHLKDEQDIEAWFNEKALR